MSHPIIGLQDWFETPPGRYLLDWEQRRFERAVVDVFGYHALQLGLPELDALQANRMPHRWLAVREPGLLVSETAQPAGHRPVALLTDYSALPFSAASLDLVVLPHALDSHPDPHATLREVARVLVPEGRVVICGFNPLSLWGLRRQRDHLCQRWGWSEPFLPGWAQTIGYRRLRDWLHLLDFEIEQGDFACYVPALGTEKWLHRLQGLDRLGSRWWPIFGAVYFLVAIKRVHGVRLLGARWKTTPSRATATVPMANRTGDNHGLSMNGKND